MPYWQFLTNRPESAIVYEAFASAVSSFKHSWTHLLCRTDNRSKATWNVTAVKADDFCLRVSAHKMKSARYADMLLHSASDSYHQSGSSSAVPSVAHLIHTNNSSAAYDQTQTFC